MNDEIRNHFERFNYKFFSFNQLLADHPNILFNISGGIRYEGIIEGKVKDIRHKRICSIQKCLRTDNLDQIGLSGRHHIFFEMLGHFSLYELDEANAKNLTLSNAWDFLTNGLSIPSDRLGFIIHPEDLVSQNFANKKYISYELSELNTTTTTSKRRSGYRVEIFWENSVGKKIELWNIVFTQFDEQKKILPLIAVDSGSSLDRLRTAVEDSFSNYHNSIWKPLVDLLQLELSLDFGRASRVGDFLKAIFYLLGEGIKPGNKRQNYVVRRLIRLVYFYVLEHLDKIKEVFDVLNSQNDFRFNTELIYNEFLSESVKFKKSIDFAKRKCFKLIASSGGRLNDEQKAALKATYGLPIELTEELIDIWNSRKELE